MNKSELIEKMRLSVRGLKLKSFLTLKKSKKLARPKIEVALLPFLLFLQRLSASPGSNQALGPPSAQIDEALLKRFLQLSKRLFAAIAFFDASAVEQFRETISPDNVVFVRRFCRKLNAHQLFSKNGIDRALHNIFDFARQFSFCLIKLFKIKPSRRFTDMEEILVLRKKEPLEQV